MLTSKFRKVVRQYSEGVVETGKYYMGFVGNLLLFPCSSKIILKIR